MKYGIIVGSHRAESQSAKIGNYAKKYLKSRDSSAEFFTLDLGKNPLPFWDEGVWKGEEKWKKVWGPISKELQSCTAFVVLAPEYAGTVPAALKNFFLLANSDDLGHKPGLIVGVSSGRGGSYPVVELRQSSYKNCRIVWMPDHMIIRNAESVLNDETPQSPDDAFHRDRFEYCLRMLTEYGKALGFVRESGVIDYKNHPFGL